MEKIKEELYTINRVLENMPHWAYLTDYEEEMKKELEKRKEILEFLLENT